MKNNENCRVQTDHEEERHMARNLMRRHNYSDGA
jgi:hypothetical protein